MLSGMFVISHGIDMQDYADLIQTHRKSNADITIATHAVGQGQASFRGCCKVEESGQQSLQASPCRPLLHRYMSMLIAIVLCGTDLLVYQLLQIVCHAEL